MATPDRRPTIWTRRLQLLTVICSAVFTVGTALQNFVFVDLELMETAMRLSGMTDAEVASAASGFLTGFRAVGAAYILGNAVGLLALRGSAWIFWVVLVVNATQAAGVFVLPPSVIAAQQALRGGASYVATLVVDGGALILALILVASLFRYRSAWAYERLGDSSSPNAAASSLTTRSNRRAASDSSLSRN
jgi:hypothetical protein